MHIWKTLDQQVVLDRAPFVRVTQETIEVAPGRVIDDFYQVHLMEFAVVVPVLEDGSIIVTRQYHHGPGKVCISFPGGHIDQDEAPDEAVLRELKEEVGLDASELIPLGKFVDNGNQRCATGHYFLARGCKPVSLPEPGGFEEIELLCWDAQRIEKALSEGEIAVIHHAALWALARPYLG